MVLEEVIPCSIGVHSRKLHNTEKDTRVHQMIMMMMMMRVEQSRGMIGRRTEVLKQNLPQCHFVRYITSGSHIEP
jgi:hypothetical protein